MAKFKHKNGGICEVFTEHNINRLRKDKNFQEVIEKKDKKNSKLKNKKQTVVNDSENKNKE